MNNKRDKSKSAVTTRVFSSSIYQLLEDGEQRGESEDRKTLKFGGIEIHIPFSNHEAIRPSKGREEKEAHCLAAL